MVEEVLIDVCFHDKMDEHIIFWKNLSFPSFSILVEAARSANESVRRILRSRSAIRPSPIVRSAPNKRMMIGTFEKGKEKEPSLQLEKQAYIRKETGQYPVLQPFP